MTWLFMLQSLRIKNFALIEDLEMICRAGLNVLTGETGAGKSILIDALNILLGDKAGPSFIRVGAEKALIEGDFVTKPVISAWLKEKELIDEGTDQEELLVMREIGKTGSRFRINGIVVNQASVNELKTMLVHVHAQHEARTLLSGQAQLNIIDALADLSHEKALAKIASLYVDKANLSKERDALRISEEERLRRLDFASFQLQELEAAELIDANEDEQLEKKQMVLANVSQLDMATAAAYEALAGDTAGGVVNSTDGKISINAIDSLQTALTSLERANKLDDELDPMITSLKDALALLEEAKDNVRHYQSKLELDPDALQQVEDRLAQLSTIKKKYGPGLEHAIERKTNLEKEINQLENAQVHASEIEQELSALENKLNEASLGISKTRKKLAKEFSQRIKTELSQLGMEHCQFEIVFDRLPEIGSSGFDSIEFTISPNPGQPLASLAKIASGGELSRIMLAIKSIVVGIDDAPTIIFDEIDAGLSGRILQTVRDKLVKLAQLRQVLCITHQPMIAAAADNHLFVEKQHAKGATTVKIKVLEGEERIKSLATMVTGQENAAVALDLAQALLRRGA
jgi:DNA repair protein RecN (Recombination protein N)